MSYGHLVSFGPAALLWLVSYIPSSTLSRVYYYAIWIAYYQGSAASLFALLSLTLTGLLFPKEGTIWRIFFVYVASEVLVFGIQDIFGQDSMVYYAMSHDSW